MAITTSLAACNVNPALNGPDGSVDLPSSIDDAIRYALSFIAQLRDGVSSAGAIQWNTGIISAFPANTPAGWLKLNGQLVSRATYPALWAWVVTYSGAVTESEYFTNAWGRYSVGDGATNFRLPDMRGMFIRGLDDGKGVDTGRPLGWWQDSTNLAHTHGVTESAHTHTASTSAAGGHSHTNTFNDPGHVHPNGVIGGSGISYAGGGGNPVPTYTNTGSATTGASVTINAVGDHAHGVTVNSAFTGLSVNSAGVAESRPQNIAWPLFVKY